jgi:hypothetical protein
MESGFRNIFLMCCAPFVAQQAAVCVAAGVANASDAAAIGGLEEVGARPALPKCF